MVVCDMASMDDEIRAAFSHNRRFQNIAPCEVVRRTTDEDDNELYAVVMNVYGNLKSKKDNMLVENLPREALWFIDAPYSTDIFLRNAFRHEIGIPDGIFPLAWRNLRYGKRYGGQ
jgi:hypothetical protein